MLRGFCLAGGGLVFGLLLQAQSLYLVGVLAKLGDDLFLDRQHGVVEIPLGGGCGISRGCHRNLSGGFGTPLRGVRGFHGCLLGGVWLHLSVVRLFVREFTRIFANLKLIRADLRRLADYFLPVKKFHVNCGDTPFA